MTSLYVTFQIVLLISWISKISIKLLRLPSYPVFKLELMYNSLSFFCAAFLLSYLRSVETSFALGWLDTFSEDQYNRLNANHLSINESNYLILAIDLNYYINYIGLYSSCMFIPLFIMYIVLFCTIFIIKQRIERQRIEQCGIQLRAGR